MILIEPEVEVISLGKCFLIRVDLDSDVLLLGIKVLLLLLLIIELDHPFIESGQNVLVDEDIEESGV